MTTANNNCPLCGGSDREPHSRFDDIGREHSIALCRSCGMVFTVLDNAVDHNKIYSEDEYEVLDNRGSIFDKIIAFEARNNLRRLQQMGTPGGALLDFGAGKGQFLSIAKSMGWEVFGIETSKPRATFARESYGLDVTDEYYDSGVIKGGPFQIVSLFHVLEHLTPSIFAELIKSNLEKDGVLFLEVPNLGSWQARIAGRRWLHLDIPRHLLHFDIHSLRSMLGQSDLEIRRLSTFSLHLGIPGMASALMSRLGYRGHIIDDLRRKRIHFWTAILLAILPIAFVLEWMAALAGRGGVLTTFVKFRELDT